MRRTLITLFVFCSLALGQGPMREIARVEWVGLPTGIAALPVGDGYIPVFQEHRVEGRGHIRFATLGLGMFDQGKLSGVPLGLARHGDSVVEASLRRGSIHLEGFRYVGKRVRNTDHGSLNVEDLRNPRLLVLASTSDAPLVVVGHDNGLVVATVKPRGHGRADLIARPGMRFIAASPPFHADRDGKPEIFAISANGMILELEQTGGRWAVTRQLPFRASGFVARAMVGREGQLWVGGARGGQAQLMLFSTSNLRRRIAPGPRRRGPAPAPPVATPATTLAIGNGSVDCIEVLDATHLVLAGAKDGRSWAGVMALGRRPTLQYEIGLSGTGVLELGVNPARSGWSFAVGTREKTYHLIRIPGDRALPRDWDPWPEPEPEPVPEPEPQPEPVPEPGPADTGQPGHRGPFAEGTVAFFPRVEADSRLGRETEIVLLHLGHRRRAVLVGFFTATGREIHTTRVILAPGHRVKLSVLDELGGIGLASFDGWVRIAGVSRRDLVVEGVTKNREFRAMRSEILRVYWR